MAPIKELFEKIKEDASADAISEEEPSQAYEEEDEDDGNIKIGGNKITSPSSKPCAKDDHKEKGIFLGHFLDGTQLWSNKLTVDTVKQLKSHMKSCTHAVDRDCTFIMVEDESEDGIAEHLRQIDCIGKRPDKKNACVYEVGAAGVAQTGAWCNTPPFRRDHFETHVRGMLNSREASEGSKSQTISATDQYYVYDLKKEGNHASMLSAFSFAKHKMQMSNPNKNAQRL